MVTVHYTAKVTNSRTLELPEEAQALGLQPGDEVQLFISRDDAMPIEVRPDADEQERFRVITARLFAEADATERKPGCHSDPQKAIVAEMIIDKHRKIGIKV